MAEEPDPTRANCDKHGSLGNYSEPQDARNAETMHGVTAHPDSKAVAAQQKANRHGKVS